MNNILNKIQVCEVCKQHLPLGPRPVIQLNEFSKIVIISQAPSRHVHETGIPWNDASGKKLKSWMNVSDEIFYNPACISIVPIYFPLPHPSPRNQNWVKINPWFMEETVPELKKRIQLAVSGGKQQGKA